MKTLPFAPSIDPPLAQWLVALAGFSAMYLPIYWWAFNTIWQTDEQAHGMIILVVVCWLFWQQSRVMLAATPRPAPIPGGMAFAVGLLIYFVGRALNISILELCSQIPVLLGALLILGGWPVLRAAWFPLTYIVFMVPCQTVGRRPDRAIEEPDLGNRRTSTWPPAIRLPARA
ncbi:MAG: archaeosortase/exosortase family protein [Sulfuritalea sp.]|nr:archaeosortase/exosortase family protein [Sulfuritalea sp.]